MGNTNWTLWTGRNKKAENLLEDSDWNSVDFTNILLKQTKDFFIGNNEDKLKSQQFNTKGKAKWFNIKTNKDKNDNSEDISSEEKNQYKIPKNYKMKLKSLNTQLFTSSEEEGCLTPHIKWNNASEDLMFEISNQRKSIKQKIRDNSIKSSATSQFTRQSTMKYTSPHKFLSSKQLDYI